MLWASRLQVPPTARERMYALVQGRESLTSARPRPAGRPRRRTRSGRRRTSPAWICRCSITPWLRWPPVAGHALLLLDPSASASASFSRGVPKPGVSVAANTEERPPPTARQRTAAGPTRKRRPTLPNCGRSTPSHPDPKQPEDPKPHRPETHRPETRRYPQGTGSHRHRATAEQRAQESLVVIVPLKAPPSILVAHQDANDQERVLEGGDVNSADQLISLPGYISEIDFPKGGQLLLRGQIPEIALLPRMRDLLESVATLHANPEFDIDMTLHRGRIFLTNTREKGPLRVRLRLLQQRSVGLDPSPSPAPMSVSTCSEAMRGPFNWKDEEPFIEAVLIVLKGNLSLKVDARVFHNMEPAPGTNCYIWNNKLSYPGPEKMPEDVAGEKPAISGTSSRPGGTV